MAEKYYKGRFAIGIYKRITKRDDTDELIELVDNAHQFAKLMGTTTQKAWDILGKHFKNRDLNVKVKGKMCELAFIDMVEEQ